MATKKAPEAEDKVTVTPLPIATNFGREDLNELRDVVNFLLSQLK